MAAHATTPAVVTLSLSVPVGQWSQALEAAVRNLVDAHGVGALTAALGVRSG